MSCTIPCITSIGNRWCYANSQSPRKGLLPCICVEYVNACGWFMRRCQPASKELVGSNAWAKPQHQGLEVIFETNSRSKANLHVLALPLRVFCSADVGTCTTPLLQAGIAAVCLSVSFAVFCGTTAHKSAVTLNMIAHIIANIYELCEQE